MSNDSNYYAVAENSSRVCTEYNSGIFPQTTPDFVFYNVGKTDVYCQALYGTAFSWIGTISERLFSPGESGHVSTGSRIYYITGLKCTNRGSIRALVYCSTTKGSSGGDNFGPVINIDFNYIAKKLVIFGVRKIPFIGKSLAKIFFLFWPQNKPSVWDQIKEKVKDLVDNKIKETLEAILESDIRYYKERINTLKDNLNDPNIQDNNITYMRIAEDLVGFEQKFKFTPQDFSDYININFNILPLYSTLVNLKVLFYYFGINNQSILKLTDSNIYLLKNYLKGVIEGDDGVIHYIPQVFNDIITETYKTCNPSNIYDSMAIVRSWCAISGFEFLPNWKAIVNNPTDKNIPYNDVISYSTHFFSCTPYFTRQMVLDDIQVPLQPKLINGKRNRMTKVDISNYKIQEGTSDIIGYKIYYENGDTFTRGLILSDISTFDFNGTYLMALTVWGNDVLNMLEFEFSDGRKQSCGWKNKWMKMQRFEMTNHYIAGILMASDELQVNGQLCSVGVSFQLNP